MFQCLTPLMYAAKRGVIYRFGVNPRVVGLVLQYKCLAHFETPDYSRKVAKGELWAARNWQTLRRLWRVIVANMFVLNDSRGALPPSIVAAVYDRRGCPNFEILGGHRPQLQ